MFYIILMLVQKQTEAGIFITRRTIDRTKQHAQHHIADICIHNINKILE